MALQVIAKVLPVVVLLLLGVLCRWRKFFGDKGLAAIKAVVSNICLPVVLFNAFFKAQYSLTVLLVFAAVYVGFGLAMTAGFATRRLAKPFDKFYPFLLTSAEGGMLGYALFEVVMKGQEPAFGFATVDLGQTVFAYTAFLGMLALTDGRGFSVSALAKNMFTNKCFLGMALGIVLGATGVGALVMASPAEETITALIDAITAPTTCLVLIIVGYELELDKKLLKPVVLTVLARLVLMAALLGLSSFVIFRVVPFDRSLQIALMILYALPAPFIIPLFAKVGNQGKYISTALSVETICTILLFIAIAAYSLSA